MKIRCTRVRPVRPAPAAFDRRIGLLIPAFNEARHLPELLGRCRDVGPAVIVVVDDGSTDDTPAVLAEAAARAPAPPLRVLRNRRNLGKQGSVRRGLRALASWKLDGVALLDGDGQHDPAELPALAALLDGQDVVLGARSRAEMPRRRRFSNWAVNLGFRGIAGVDLVDIQSGVRLYRKAVADALAARLPIVGGYGVEYEAFVALARWATERGTELRVAAAPIACRYGLAESKLGAGHVVRLARDTVRQAVRLRRSGAAAERAPARPRAARALTVEIHDASPATAADVEALRAELADLGVDRTTLLVVPAMVDPQGRPWDLREHAGFADWLRGQQQQGSEIVLHGLTHRAPGPPPPHLPDRILHRWFARGCDEFAFLTRDEATRRLETGRGILRDCGLWAEGFVAPAWLQSRGALEAVERLGFRYTAFLTHVQPLVGDRTPVSTPALTFAASNPLVDYGKRALMRGCEAWARPAPLLRVALHPADRHGARPFEHALARLRRLLRYRRLVTYGEWLAERPGSVGA
jgi:uncharacterized protein